MARRNRNNIGRPTLYQKPHRTTITESELVRDKLLPDLTEWLGCSRNDVREAALREFHRMMRERRRSA